jgi:hypothetical protein
MTSWKVRACTRCGGDMFIDRGIDSWYEVCLQCSYRVELKPLKVVKEPAIAERRGSKKHHAIDQMPITRQK